MNWRNAQELRDTLQKVRMALIEADDDMDLPEGHGEESALKRISDSIDDLTIVRITLLREMNK